MAFIFTKKKVIAKRIITRDSNYLGDYKKDRSVHLFNHERVRSTRVVGWCHNVIHQGYIDAWLLEKHNCLNVLGKDTECEHFEKINNTYWGLLRPKTNKTPKIADKPIKQDKELTAAQIAEISVAIDATQKRRKKIWEQKPPIEKISATTRKLLLKKDAYMTSLRDLGDFYEVTYIAEKFIILKDESYILRTLFGNRFKMRYVRTDIEKVRYLLNRAKGRTDS
ncbi:MAG: hypothetical protein FWH48_02930 [Oscillospiraceae bacterium]|nr:hypothetical protein [Oscillospiraceae bacterium]